MGISLHSLFFYWSFSNCEDYKLKVTDSPKIDQYAARIYHDFPHIKIESFNGEDTLNFNGITQ